MSPFSRNAQGSVKLAELQAFTRSLIPDPEMSCPPIIAVFRSDTSKQPCYKFAGMDPRKRLMFEDTTWEELDDDVQKKIDEATAFGYVLHHTYQVGQTLPSFIVFDVDNECDKQLASVQYESFELGDTLMTVQSPREIGGFHHYKLLTRKQLAQKVTLSPNFEELDGESAIDIIPGTAPFVVIPGSYFPDYGEYKVLNQRGGPPLDDKMFKQLAAVTKKSEAKTTIDEYINNLLVDGRIPNGQRHNAVVRIRGSLAGRDVPISLVREYLTKAFNLMDLSDGDSEYTLDFQLSEYAGDKAKSTFGKARPGSFLQRMLDELVQVLTVDKGDAYVNIDNPAVKLRKTALHSVYPEKIPVEVKNKKGEVSEKLVKAVELFEDNPHKMIAHKMSYYFAEPSGVNPDVLQSEGTVDGIDNRDLVLNTCRMRTVPLPRDKGQAMNMHTVQAFNDLLYAVAPDEFLDIVLLIGTRYKTPRQLFDWCWMTYSEQEGIGKSMLFQVIGFMHGRENYMDSKLSAGGGRFGSSRLKGTCVFNDPEKGASKNDMAFLLDNKKSDISEHYSGIELKGKDLNDISYINCIMLMSSNEPGRYYHDIKNRRQLVSISKPINIDAIHPCSAPFIEQLGIKTEVDAVTRPLKVINKIIGDFIDHDLSGLGSIYQWCVEVVELLENSDVMMVNGQPFMNPVDPTREWLMADYFSTRGQARKTESLLHLAKTTAHLKDTSTQSKSSKLEDSVILAEQEIIRGLKDSSIFCENIVTKDMLFYYGYLLGYDQPTMIDVFSRIDCRKPRKPRGSTEPEDAPLHSGGHMMKVKKVTNKAHQYPAHTLLKGMVGTNGKGYHQYVNGKNPMGSAIAIVMNPESLMESKKSPHCAVWAIRDFHLLTPELYLDHIGFVNSKLANVWDSLKKFRLKLLEERDEETYGPEDLAPNVVKGVFDGSNDG